VRERDEIKGKFIYTRIYIYIYMTLMKNYIKKSECAGWINVAQNGVQWRLSHPG
jgi:hypothetical protein